MALRVRGWIVWMVLAAAGAVGAQPNTGGPPPSADGRPLFGMEFEFAGAGNRIVNFENMPWENYERLMRRVVEYYGGNPAGIRRVEFTKPTTNLERWPSGQRPLFRAEWTDPRGRVWRIEPEYVSSTGLDGYEVVTPPMDNPRELAEVLERIRSSGLVREGLKSGVHLNLDGRRLISSTGDARALTNLILMHENLEPQLRRLFSPVRGGGDANRFARSLYADHAELLQELDRLRPEERTRENLERLFRRFEGREMRLHGVDPMDPNSAAKSWKYRALNLAKVLNINPLHNGNLGVVEFRMFDLHALESPQTHRLQADLYRRLVERAIEMAERGETVRLQPRRALATGEGVTAAYTPADGPQARAEIRTMLESLGLDPAEYREVIERNVRTRVVPTEAEARGILDRLPRGRVTSGGVPFTYGFELEGSGAGFARIAVPKNAEVAARWGSMTDAQKMDYYREVVGTNRSVVPRFFELDLQRFPWMDPSWKVEGSGNWEIRSKPFESLQEATQRMREVVELTGRSAKGFHLHMRDNNVNWERLSARSSQFADWIERAANWVWMERARRLGTMTSMKSWSNARPSTGAINNLAELRSSDRSTIRVTVPSDRSYVDVEIRGFTKYVNEIERLAAMTTEALRTGNFGPWNHTANRMVNGGNGGDAPRELRFVEAYERYLAEVEGRSLSPEMRRVMDGLQHEYINRSNGTRRTYSTNVGAPLLPWASEAALDPVTRREMRFAREEYLREMGRMAERVTNGRYGLDVEVANERALREVAGLSEREARAVVEARRARGGTLGESAEVLRYMAAGVDPARAARANGFDLERAGVEELRSRFGLSEAEARRVVELREPVSPRNAMERAGISEAETTRLIERAGGVNLTSLGATAEVIERVGGVSPETARRIVEFRDANAINGVEDLRRAGVSEADARRLWELRGQPPVELATASVEELRRAGLSEAEARAVEAAREARTLRNYNELRSIGISEAEVERLRGDRRVNMERLNTWSVSELMERAGLSEADARRVRVLREATNVGNQGRGLVELFGEERAREVRLRASGLDVTTANEARLRAAGLSEADARRVVHFRDANRLGGGWSYDANAATRALREAGVVTEAEAERLRSRTAEVELERAPAERLVERLGLSPEVANRVVELRDATAPTSRANLERAGIAPELAERMLEASRALDLRTATTAEVVERTGLSEAEAERLRATAGVDLRSATAAELAERLGISNERASRLVEIRESLARAPGLDVNEINRQVRYRVKVWARETGLSEALMRTLLPLPEARAEVTRDNTRRGEGFAGTREGAAGPTQPLRMARGLVESVFVDIRESALERANERLSEARGETERATVREGIRNLEGLRLEIVETNRLFAELAENNRVRVSSGLLNELETRAERMPPEIRELFRMRTVGLIMGHEAAHASGVRAERLADMESLRIVERARMSTYAGIPVPVSGVEIRETVAAFDRPTGATRFDNLLNRLRNLFRYGTPGGRASVIERAARGEMVDPLERFRRADGTLRWGEVTRDRALREGAGLLHFGLALFLKELAAVTATGDRARIEEFFDGLMTTDFYKHYGLFILGARAGEVAYTRYLERYIKPRFVNGILKSNLVLAAGIALPMIVEGNFEGRTFVILLGSLGISSAAVKSGMAGIRWVTRVGRGAAATGAAARTAGAASRLARFGGWVYTAAELAVVLWLAEEIDAEVNDWLDRREAREGLREAGLALEAATRDPAATEATVSEAAANFHMAWADFRNFLYRDMQAEEAIFADRLERAARRAKLAADEREATLERVRSRPALMRSIESRYGSLEAYADSLLAEDEAELQEEVDMYVESYNINRDGHLRSIYEGHVRGEGLLDDVGHLDWVLAGGEAGAEGDPYGGRGDFFAGMGRDRARGAWEEALGNGSRNRLQTYEDQDEILAALERSLLARGREDLVGPLAATRELVTRTREADERLYHGDGSVGVEEAIGFVDAINGVGEASEGSEEEVELEAGGPR